MESITSLKELYLDFIRDIYHAEVLLIPELRFFVEKAPTEALKKVINNHLSQTRLHTSKLEEIQENLHSDILQDHCRTMKSMILESKELVERCSGGKLTERVIVASLHRITHCQITIYQILIAMADELRFPPHKKILQQHLEDEAHFDQQISAYGFNMLWQEFNIVEKLS